MKLLVLLLLCLLLACNARTSPTPAIPPEPNLQVYVTITPALVLESLFSAATPRPTATLPAAPTETATQSPTPTWTPLPTHTPTPTPTFHLPISDDSRRQYFIPGMRERAYPGGQIEKTGVFGGKTDQFTTYLIRYSSEGLRISGMMNVPAGSGPFPIVILCHGFIVPAKYAAGMDTWRTAAYLAEHGYITIAPDYRGHANSDPGTSFFHIGYAQDVLNLISSLHTIEKADPNRAGLWGHSMGGAVALKAAVVAGDRVRAVVLVAPVSGDERVNTILQLGDNFEYDENNPALFDSPEIDFDAYALMSSINYLAESAPLSIHQGLKDTITPPKLARRLYQAAREQGVTVEFHEYPDQTHTLRGDDWETSMERIVSFYNVYLIEP